jgi:hypothetical protein
MVFSLSFVTWPTYSKTESPFPLGSIQHELLLCKMGKYVLLVLKVLTFISIQGPYA